MENYFWKYLILCSTEGQLLDYTYATPKKNNEKSLKSFCTFCKNCLILSQFGKGIAFFPNISSWIITGTRINYLFALSLIPIQVAHKK